jgi:thioredoxin reductase
MYDLIIIGGGPSGLTAAVYALRKRLNVLLVSQDLGGKTNWHLQIPNLDHHLVINGAEVVSRFASEIEYLEFARVLDKVVKIERVPRGYWVRLQSGRQYGARALIVATGASARRLDVPGEREFAMRGVVYSAVSYAPLFVERSTVVVGDGLLALRAAAELAQIARHVTLVAPSHGELDSPLGERLRGAAHVTILEGFQVERITGDGFARSIVVAQNGDRREITADAFFVELGLVPASDLLADLVARDPQGRIRIDGRNRTSAPGIFAAGDVTDAFAEQVLIAVGEGAKAALSAYEYLLGQPEDEGLAVPALEEEWR